MEQIWLEGYRNYRYYQNQNEKCKNFEFYYYIDSIDKKWGGV